MKTSARSMPDARTASPTPCSFCAATHRELVGNRPPRSFPIPVVYARADSQIPRSTIENQNFEGVVRSDAAPWLASTHEARDRQARDGGALGWASRGGFRFGERAGADPVH